MRAPAANRDADVVLDSSYCVVIPTVHEDRLPIEGRHLVSSEKDDGVGDLLCGSRPPCGNRGDKARSRIGLTANETLHHACPNGAPRDRINSHT